MELQIKSQLHENNFGELSYKIEMVYEDDYSWSNFTCIIDLDYYNYPKFRMALIDLACQDTTLETKMEVIQLIMSLVQTIEVINDYEISDILEDEELEDELILLKFLLDFAVQFSTEQLAPLFFFNRKLNIRNFINYTEFDLN